MSLTFLSQRPLLPLPPLLIAGMLCLAFCASASAATAPKPHPPAAHGKPAEQVHTAQIPFDYNRVLMPYIVVQVSINGQPPLPFVVDTGSGGALLFIEPWAAQKLGLPLLAVDKDQFVPGQGQKTLTSTLIKTMKIVGTDEDKSLNLTFNNAADTKKETPFQVVSVIGFVGDKYQGPPPAGIIPSNLLSLPNMVWQIDFQRRLLILTQKMKDWKPVTGSVVVPLHRHSNYAYSLSVVLAADRSLQFLLDTGSPVTSIQNSAALSIFGEQSAKEVGDNPNRMFLYDVMLLPRFQIGSLVEPNVTIWENSGEAVTSSANIIGMDFLSRFLVTLDLGENKMYLKRRSDYALQAAPEATSEVRLEKRAGQYAAAWVAPGSPADLAGLHAGDLIKKADGQPLGALPFPAARNLLDGFEGTTAKLEVRTDRGKESALSFSRSKKFPGHRHALLGVSLDWVQGELLVSGVATGDPLEHALKWGDDLYSVNGVPVAKMTMDEAFRQLERPDVALQVWRDTDKTWQELHLAPLPAQTQVLSGPLPAVNRYSFDARKGWTAAPL